MARMARLKKILLAVKKTFRTLKSAARALTLAVAMFLAASVAASSEDNPPADSAGVSPGASARFSEPMEPSAATSTVQTIQLPGEDSAKNDKPQMELDINGFRYLKFRGYESSGNSEEFQSREGLINFGERIEQGTNLTIDAKMGDGFTLEGKFDEMPSQDRHMMFRLERGDYGATFGDFTADLKGGAFSPLSKSIEGFQIDYNTDRDSVTAVTSRAKSSTKSVVVTGRNIKGPYDLNARDLVPDKIEVRLNEIVLSPDEYVLDAFLGEITFNRILGPNDIATISFEQKLPGSLTEGAIVGFSAERKSANGKFVYGFTRLEQQANRESRRLTESVSSEVPVVNGRYLEVGKGYIVHWDSVRGSETIVKNGVETLEPNVHYNWQGELQAHEIDILFAQGRFLLRDEPLPTDTFAVSYSYYPLQTSLREALKEELSLDITGTIGYPARSYIYSGSENIYICSDAELSICPTLLVRGDDYTVDERLNRVVFTTPRNSPNERVRIDYRYYPDASAFQSEYDHTMNDFRLAYKDDGLSLEYERAMSEADVSSRPIPSLNEIILSPPAADIECFRPDMNRQCTFPTANKNIVAGTMVVYFNDRISQEGVLKNYADYTVDTERGEITIKILIPAGTTIIADYQHNPDMEDGLKTGTRDRLAARFDKGATAAMFSLDTGDTFFTPIGGAPNMETKRLSYGVSQRVSDNIQLSADWMNTFTALDILDTHSRKNSSSKYSLSMSSKMFSQLRVDFDQRKLTDDYSPSRVDNQEDKITASLAMPAPYLKNADISAGYSTADFNDNAPDGSDTGTVSMRLGFNWRSSETLSFNAELASNDVDTDGPQAQFTSGNRSRKLGLKWDPIPLISIGADIDSQTTTDSRDTVADREIQRSSLSISSRQFGRVKNIQIRLMQNDSPSVSGPSSGAKSLMVSSGIIITDALSYNPSFSRSDSYSGETSSSKNTTSRHEFDFSPAEKPYRARFSIKNSVADSNNSSGASSTESDNWNLTLDYVPSQVWSYSVSYQMDTYSATSSEGYDTSVFQARAARKPNPTLNQWLQWRLQSRTGSSGESYNSLDFGMEKELTKIMSFKLTYRMSDFESERDLLRGYSGHVLESVLQANF
ncbi:MAG: hypothetical protein BWY28_01534 [bacterium ADurb.Bin236]|nr:MAG: hypothetical protein BWY28_01534 [bacterium ADurb.Bin236]